MKSYKVLLTTQLTPYLHLVQTPSKSHLPNLHERAIRGRFKKVSRAMELDVPLNTRHETYSKIRGEDFAISAQMGSIKLVGGTQQNVPSKMLDTVTLSGGPVSELNAKYFVGVVRDEQVHLTPVNTVLQLRPRLGYLDDMDAKTKASTKKLADLDKPNQSDQVKAVQLQFRKKETVEQIAARLNSYAYLKRQVDEEAWINVSHFSQTSQEALKVAERLVCEKEDRLEFKEVDRHSFIESFFK